MDKRKLGVSITLGNRMSLHMDNDDELYIVHRIDDVDPTFLSLGKGTKQRFADLMSHIQRLSIHATDA